ncbi:sigma-70 family RNA polymerase sigma factor [Fulvivirga sp. 29W222]|uniref:Sigma-70 family RNA polymerase sigma factor n=1 Tax=Fulvivirga marina TaxID=2494733 RepID=A0A937FUQ5_9BACT|nr:sigma-70 family RNA polymerase sigma factor [Fulvivirga marina]MBL6446399.1 sigma-70 family RNA polymerase sigma factor [Fulvivirga marina]
MLINTTTTDYDLLDIIADKEDPFRKEAFVIFHNRHASYIHNTSLGFCKTHDDCEAEAKDLSQEVFRKILNRSGTFQRNKSVNTEEIVKHVRKWLFTITKNTFLDLYKKPVQYEYKTVRINDENKDIIARTIHEKTSGKSKKLSKEDQILYDKIVDAMSQINLSEKQNHILKAYLESGQFDSSGKWSLPDYRMEELMEKYKLKRNSVIQIKERVVDKIQEQVKTNQQNH